MGLAFQLLPIIFRGLLVFIIPKLVVAGPCQLIGQVLLPDPVAWKVVGIAVALFPLLAGGIGMHILQFPWDGSSPSLFHIAPGSANGVDHRIGFRRGCQQHRRLGQRELGFRQPKLHGGSVSLYLMSMSCMIGS